MVNRELYRHQQRVKYDRPIADDRTPDHDLPTVGEFLGGLAFMLALAACLWLLPFVVDALRGIS